MKAISIVLLVASSWTQSGLVAQAALVLLDVAHHNVFAPEAGSPFFRFLERSGYRTTELREPFTRDVLAGVDIVIIGGALSGRNALPRPFTQEQFDSAWSRPVPSAFTDGEIEVLHDWVSEGGGLVLVFDHMPVGGAARDLAAAFGFEVSDGFAVNSRSLPDLSAASVARAGSVVFHRSDRTIADHPVTRGRGLAERIDSIATWTGSAFRVPPPGRWILTLGSSFVSLVPDTAWVFSDSTRREDIGGWSQGAVLTAGQGRVAVFAELGILAAPEAAAASDRETNPQVQNPQLLLNVLRWLRGM